jgi:hypothetical protein
VSWFQTLPGAVPDANAVPLSTTPHDANTPFSEHGRFTTVLHIASRTDEGQAAIDALEAGCDQRVRIGGEPDSGIVFIEITPLLAAGFTSAVAPGVVTPPTLVLYLDATTVYGQDTLHWLTRADVLRLRTVNGDVTEFKVPCAVARTPGMVATLTGRTLDCYL